MMKTTLTKTFSDFDCLTFFFLPFFFSFPKSVVPSAIKVPGSPPSPWTASNLPKSLRFADFGLQLNVYVVIFLSNCASL